MRILAIRGRNLASLAGDFEVDFQTEPLADAGLFAISGPTGAGKSTLLDALCLALYDETPRLSGANARGIELPDVGEETTLPGDRRNILRRGCAEGYAEVDFVGNDGVAYRARWSVRRARSKVDGRLQPTEMSLLRVADGQPVGSQLKSEVQKAIAERIGLSFEQFTRAVLLAQNEFFTFLKAGEDERAALLQTLTGTDRFEQISRRAFERNKAEQEKLRNLRARLADQQPLSPEERARRETEAAGLRAALAEHDGRRQGLAARLRWHEEFAQLQRREADARTALEQALALQHEAAPRHALLARIEAASSARPLVDESERLARERTALATQQAAAGAALAEAEREVAAAAAQEQAATAALADADAVYARFLPALARARELDAEIAALRPEQTKAAAALADADAALQRARSDVAARENARRQASDALEATRRWLSDHQDIAPLAQGWMRWDALFAGAREAEQARAQAAGEVERLTAAAAAHAVAMKEAEAAQETAAARLRERETEYRTAAEAQTFDPEALARRRGEQQRHAQALQAAELRWQELGDRARRLAELQTEADVLRQALTEQQARLAAARSRLPVAEAEAREAERAWRTVFEATRVEVEALRGALEPGAPCPVCGALEHPYASRHPGLDDALARLAANRDQSAQTLAELRVLIQSGTAQLDALTEQERRSSERRTALQAEHAAAERAWQESCGALAALFGGDGPAGSDPAMESLAWLAARKAELAAAQQALEEEDARQRRAQAALQQTQAALDAARTAHQSARDALARLQAEASRNQATLTAARAAWEAAAARRADLLGQLDAARVPAWDLSQDWRSAWQLDPEAYHRRCRSAAEEWLAKQQAAAALEQDAARLQTEVHGLAQLAAQAQTRHRAAAIALSELDDTLKTRAAARTEAFAGLQLPAQTPGGPSPSTAALSTAEIEAALAAHLDAARSRLATSAEAHKRAEAARAAAQATEAQLARQAAALQAAAEKADQAIADWLAAFNAREQDAATSDPVAPLDLPALKALLAHDAGWIATERRALQEIDTAVARARGGLEQVSAQCRHHEQLRPPGDESAEALQDGLQQLDQAIAALRETLGGVEVALRHDDEIRQRAAALIAQIDAQEAAARVWAQMNELIGAADGKKFRNYAQQLTLDILLGYANAHLRDLARRYRLERVPNSLALMVVDQDMGDEQRSVHSLSGGESFLVSLALALGLASLSSHRVRVESLFIDEGFGSLDADTLRMAMDALDRLQAQGRKVGVISHVEEMTERIGTRIQVRRLAGGRSRIVVGDAA